jgi:ribosome biogenesis GTPase A
VTGAIKETAVDNDDIAYYAVEYFIKTYPELLKQRYELPDLDGEVIDVMEMIGQRRGCLRGGGQVDLERVSKIILTEFRSAMLGQITLENPTMMERELIELEQIRAEKQAKKEARKQAKAKKKNRR